MKLSITTRYHADIVIVECQGRIVYRDEAATLSNLVGENLEKNGRLVLDLGRVTCIDSAGLGELVLLYTLAQSKNAALICARPTPFVRRLLDITHLDSVLEIHPSLDEALVATQVESERVCAV